MEKHAGIKFTTYIREQSQSIPILLQTSEENLDFNQIIDKLNSPIIRKNSPKFFKDIKLFMKNNFGFGDFIFKTDNKNDEPIRAKDINGLLIGIENIDPIFNRFDFWDFRCYSCYSLRSTGDFCDYETNFYLLYLFYFEQLFHF